MNAASEVPPGVDPQTGEVVDPPAPPPVDLDVVPPPEDDDAERVAGHQPARTSTAPDAKTAGDPNPAPPSAAPDATPNFVILAGVKPAENAKVTLTEVGRVVARTTEDAKSVALKTIPVVKQQGENGGVVVAAVPIRSWKPELFEPAPPAPPKLKGTALA